MKQISRRRFVARVSSAGMVLLAGSKRVRAQGHEKLTIGLSPFINQATIFLANELGYFSKMGLDIDMKIFMDGGGPLRAFLCNGQGRRGRAVTPLSFAAIIMMPASRRWRILRG